MKDGYRQKRDRINNRQIKKRMKDGYRKREIE